MFISFFESFTYIYIYEQQGEIINYLKPVQEKKTGHNEEACIEAIFLFIPIPVKFPEPAIRGT